MICSFDEGLVEGFLRAQPVTSRARCERPHAWEKLKDPASFLLIVPLRDLRAIIADAVPTELEYADAGCRDHLSFEVTRCVPAQGDSRDDRQKQ